MKYYIELLKKKGINLSIKYVKLFLRYIVK